MQLQSLLKMSLVHERDVARARRLARSAATSLGFEQQDGTRIATAVSEIVRNAWEYARGGRVEFLAQITPPSLVITVNDDGKGIRELESVLNGAYRSPSGLGVGIRGARRLMSRVEIDSGPSGTSVTMTKLLPVTLPVLTDTRIASAVVELARLRDLDPITELRDQNRELLEALEEKDRLNRELDDTNRGVMALYQELDEKARSLQQASEMKTRFLSNMTHEFRTPLNTIVGLANLLMDRVDGELSEEQARQVQFIRKSAESLAELVNDLLDIAKIEAGKVTVHVGEFSVKDLLGALRATVKPLAAQAPNVELRFEEPDVNFPGLFTDEGKVSQIVRNFISNALKFTRHGAISVKATEEPPDRVRFDVTDTGIGIAAADQERIFGEFVQIDNETQRLVRGTGLGLSLSRGLAELLGGEAHVQSELGKGSTFSTVLPRVYPGVPVLESPAVGQPGPINSAVAGRPAGGPPGTGPVPASSPSDTAVSFHRGTPPPSLGLEQVERTILIVDDEESSRYLLTEAIRSLGHRSFAASSAQEGLELAERTHPDAILLDLRMPGVSGFELLDRLKSRAATQSIPVVIITGDELGDDENRLLMAADVVLQKGVRGREETQQELLQAFRIAWARGQDRG